MGGTGWEGCCRRETHSLLGQAWDMWEGLGAKAGEDCWTWPWAEEARAGRGGRGGLIWGMTR